MFSASQPPEALPRGGATPWRAQHLEEAQASAGARRRLGSGGGDGGDAAGKHRSTDTDP